MRSKVVCDDLSRRFAIELYCLFLVFRFHRENSHLRKATTIMLFVVWSIVTVGITFDALMTVKPPHYGVLSAIVFAIIGRMWGIEVENFTNLAMRDGDDDD